MITADQVENHFYPVAKLPNGIVRGADELPKQTHYTYFGAPMAGDITPLTESLDLVDDNFAAFVLRHADPEGTQVLTKTVLPANSYGFSHLLSVPPAYHSLLKGRGELEEKRVAVILCLPIHDCEFSGNESVEEFYDMRRRTVPTTTWTRVAVPKIRLRFDNPRSGRGTGDVYTLATIESVIKLTADLADDRQSFIELINARDLVAELLQSDENYVTWITDREDASAVMVGRDQIAERIREYALG